MNCFTAKACGRWLPLLSITLQGCTSFRHLTFHSVHCQPPASVTHARVLPSFHCAQANPQFHSAPLWLVHPTFQNSNPKREAALHPSQFATLHSVTTLAFPSPISGMSCEVFTPENERPQNSPPPFNGAGKNKGSFAHGLRACSRFVSLIQPFALTLVPRDTVH
jgi:hypothetical protein